MKLDPSMFQADPSEINIRKCIDELKQQGVSMHPIFDDRDHLVQMLQKYSDIHDSIVSENPEMPPELVRSASQS
eukprot:CAMPEP_0168314324 /NCGR_PEP_ID=MMETSP0210-20121227/7171_1 /TAXON_ID=40633 /ORGANISM="Condylostoma magnum, Strain COL2" /LENGTH=73 /DNA_ID=CAMNT_0008280455 /DNA_START=367 /DNA_END=588 /DNA_ORIENTATION=-